MAVTANQRTPASASASRQRQDVRTAGVGHPAVTHGAAVADVQGGHDAIGAVALDEHAAQRRPADEGAAQDDAVGAGRERLRRLVRVTDAAGDLAAHAGRGHDGRHDGRLQRLALASRVQVHDVDARGALVRPAAGDGDRVVAVVGDGVEVAAREAHDPPAQQVDGRDHFHAQYATMLLY